MQKYMGSLENLGNKHVSKYIHNKSKALNMIMKDGTKARDKNNKLK